MKMVNKLSMGRHPVLCFSLIISGVIGCLSALVPYVQMFVALRFLQGICFPVCFKLFKLNP